RRCGRRLPTHRALRCNVLPMSAAHPRRAQRDNAVGSASLRRRPSSRAFLQPDGASFGAPQGAARECWKRTLRTTKEQTTQPIRITGHSEMSVADWAALHRRTPAPTFSAQPAWALALHDAYGYYTPAPLWCHTGDGARCAVPLVASRGRMPWRVYSGMPLDTYTLALGEDGRPAPPAVAAA